MKLRNAFIPAAAAVCSIVLFCGCFSQSSSTSASPGQNAGPASASSIRFITENDAKMIALNHADLNENEVMFTRTALTEDDGRHQYEVEFYKGHIEYDYQINAVTGEVITFDTDAEFTAGSGSASSSLSPASNPYIGGAEAQRIALADAGFSESEVSDLHTVLGIDNGRAEYEVEWFIGNTEYSYEIDAENGEILSRDVDEN